MHTVQYQRWNPPQSPVRIEFPPQLVAEAGQESDGEARGSLYGIAIGGEIRIVAASTGSNGLPPRSFPGAEKIGIFTRRADGEVFLSESDLESFEGQRAAVALVIAGDRAGFFVRQADGSIQAIRSHEEFAVPDVAQATSLPSRQACRDPLPAPNAPLVQAIPNKTARWPLTAALFLAIPLAGLAYFLPGPSTPSQLRLRQIGSGVTISWNPASVALAVDESAVDESMDEPPKRAAPPPDPAELRAQVESLEAEASLLRQSVDSGQSRIARLQKIIDSLTHR